MGFLPEKSSQGLPSAWSSKSIPITLKALAFYYYSRTALENRFTLFGEFRRGIPLLRCW